MEKCLFSKYTKPDAMDSIKADIVRYNKIKRYAFSLIVKMGGDKPFSDGTSIHNHLKDKFDVNDHFANAAKREAVASYKSAMECLKLNAETLESKIKQESKKLSSEQKRLDHLKEEKASLVNRSLQRKSGSNRKAKFKPYRGGNESETSEGTFQVRKGKKVTTYKNQYLFEVQYLTPEIKRVEHRIRCIEQRRTRHEHELERIKSQIDNGRPSVCFGSRKLFKQQNTIYAGRHDEWLKEYRSRRNNGMTIPGRKGIIQGNCVVRYDTDTKILSYDSMTRIPIKTKSSKTKKKSVLRAVTSEIKGVEFPYGQNFVNYAMNNESRQAVAWRFEDAGNRILIKCMMSVEQELPRQNEYYADGCISFDTNVDHLAMTELDRHGNLIHHEVIRFDITGKTNGQREQILSNSLEKIFKYARQKCKPIAMENLKDIKNESMYKNEELNRKLSEFAYTKITQLAESKSYKYGIGLYKAAPAFTSQIGKIKYMRHYGISIHVAAAMAIGRRAMGFKERPPKKLRHLIPQDNKNRHHWSQWRFLARYLKKQPAYKFYHMIPYDKFECITDMNKYMKEEFYNYQNRAYFLKKLMSIFNQLARTMPGVPIV